MYITIKGKYQKGKIELLEDLPNIEQADVLITFQNVQNANHDASIAVDFTKYSAFGMWKKQFPSQTDIELAKNFRNGWDRDNE